MFGTSRSRIFPEMFSIETDTINLKFRINCLGESMHEKSQGQGPEGRGTETPKAGGRRLWDQPREERGPLPLAFGGVFHACL